MALQPIQGYPSSWHSPFVAMELDLGQGPSSAAAGPREACYVGPMTSAGTWTAGTLYPVSNEQDAINGAGVGSPLHRMIRFHLKSNPNGKIYALPYAASSGAGGVAATGTITWATNPGKSGQTRVWVCGEQVSQNFTTSDTVTTIATGIRDKINAKVHLPVTAAIVAGVLTLTAKIIGASQGDGTVVVIRFRAEIDPGVTTTVAVSGSGGLGVVSGTAVAGVDGATTELSNATSALANIATMRLYYLGFSLWDATSLTTIKTHIVNKNAPSPGLTGRAVTGYTSTLSAGITVAVAKNTELMHIMWQKNSEHDTAELAAQFIAIHQMNEQTDAAYPGFDGYRGQGWLLLPAASNADWPSDQDKEDAVNGGLNTVMSDQVGAALVMSVTTRSKDSTGLINDFRATETHRVSVMHFMSDTIRLNHRLTFTSVGFKLQDDPKLPDGTVDVNAVHLLPPKVMCPAKYKPWFFDQLKQLSDAALIQNLAGWRDRTRVNIDPQNSSRLEVGTAGRVIDILHQTSFRVSETSPG
jgi:phage tail sheath gpL-like